MFKIWGKNAVTQLFFNLVWTPELSFFDLLAVKSYLVKIVGYKIIYKLGFDLGIPSVVTQRFGGEIFKANLFKRLTTKGSLKVFAERDVSPNRGIPFTWLNQFVHRSFLKEDMTIGVQYMQVNHRMKNFLSPMA